MDELQEAGLDELTAVNTAVHLLGQASVPLPVTFVGAGLPSLPAQLADATSYAERLYDYRPIGLLDDPAARTALVGPSAERGVEWDEQALRRALVLAGGYPYFLQAIGKHVWDAAAASPINIEDVTVGGDFARREVDVSDLSVARNELIKKGLVYAPERGLLAFTVPGMSDFISRQH